MSSIPASRIAEIRAALEAWCDQHLTHVTAGVTGCGCNPFQDVICRLPEYDPGDARNLAIPPQLDEYVLRDGTIIDGEHGGWRIIRATQEGTTS